MRRERGLFAGLRLVRVTLKQHARGTVPENRRYRLDVHVTRDEAGRQRMPQQMKCATSDGDARPDAWRVAGSMTSKLRARSTARPPIVMAGACNAGDMGLLMR